MQTKPPDLIYGVDETPPTTTLLLLGPQHIFLVTSSLVFPVVIIRAVGGTTEDATFIVTMSMLAGGIGTVLQTINRKGIGSGISALRSAALRISLHLSSRSRPGASPCSTA